MNQHLLAVYTDTARDVIRQLPYDKSLSSVKALTKQLEIATNPSFTTPNSLIFNVFHLNPEWTELRKRMA